MKSLLDGGYVVISVPEDTFLAALSASSFPFIPVWPGIHRITSFER